MSDTDRFTGFEELKELAAQYATVRRARPIDWAAREDLGPVDADTFQWPDDAGAAYVVRLWRRIPGETGTELLAVYASLRQRDVIEWAVTDLSGATS